MGLATRSRLTHSWLIDRYGEEIGLWLGAHFDLLEYNEETGQGFDHIDNRRCYELNNAEEKTEFQRQSDDGCCGNYEKQLHHPNGRVFVIGFNYGH